MPSAGLTRERIQSFILDPLAELPGADLDTLKKLRILTRYAIDQKILSTKGKEIRAWTDAELDPFKRRYHALADQIGARLLNLAENGQGAFVSACDDIAAGIQFRNAVSVCRSLWPSARTPQQVSAARPR